VARYLLCNRVIMPGSGVELKAAKEIDDTLFDIPTLRAQGAVLLALPNPIVEARAEFVRREMAKGRREAELDLLTAAFAEFANGSGGGITPADHETLRQLIHLADGVGGPMDGWPSGSFRELLPLGSPFPTLVTWWTDAGKTKKIVEKLITFDAQKRVTAIKWAVYDVDGTTVLAQVTDAISYSTVFETSRTRTVT
jgi:hypothetical protein